MNTQLRKEICVYPEFVDRRVRICLRIVFAALGVAIGFWLIAQRLTVPIDHGNGQMDQSKVPPTLTVEKPEEPVRVPGESNTAGEEPTKLPTTEPAEPVPTQDNSVVTVEPQPDSSSISETKQSDRQPESTTGADSIPSVLLKPPFEIIGGTTAPQYVLASNDLYGELALDRRCRFVITDGKLTVEVGRKLKPTASMRSIGSEWHENYAKRMVLMPSTRQVNAVVAEARQRYLLAANAQCYLSVPHELDVAIFDAQKEYLGENWDVAAITEIDFFGTRPVVLGTVTANQK